MGSLGNYEAYLFVKYERQIKISEPNSDEDIDKFLKFKGNFFGKVLKEDTTDDDLNIIDKDEYVGFWFKFNDEIITTYKVRDNISKVEKKQKYWEHIYPIVSMSVDELRYLDLNILKDFECYNESEDYSTIKVLGEIGSEVYYESCDENKSYSFVELSDEVLRDLLDKKCTLHLEGDSYRY